MVISVRHYAKRVKSAERTKLTKQIKRTKRKQGEDNEQTETVHLQVRTPANARRSQLAGRNSYRGLFVCDVRIHGRFLHTIRAVGSGGWLAEAGSVSASVQGHPEYAVRRNRAGDDAVGTHAFKTHVGGLARRVGIQIG